MNDNLNNNEKKQDEKMKNISGYAEGVKIKGKILADEAKKRGTSFTKETKKSGKEFVNDVKDYKNLSGKKKQRLWIAGGAILILLIIAVVLMKGCSGNGGLSKKEIARRAIIAAETKEGYELTVDTCDVVETRKIKRENTVLGAKTTNYVYGVLLKADVKDTSGNVAYSVKYGVVVAEWLAWGNASDYTDIEDAEIVELIKEDIQETIEEEEITAGSEDS